MNSSTALQDVVKTIRDADKILICAHTQADGDAVGSSIALAYTLKALNKQFILYNETGFPKWLSFIEKPSEIIENIESFPFEPELIIALDCGDPKRLGDVMAEYIKTKKSINIDHHIGNPHYGSVANWVDSGKAATGEMVAELSQALNVTLYKPLAEALYVALSADTGNFTFGNTRISTLEWLVKLAATPIDIPSIRVQMDNNWTLNKFKFWGQLYQEIEIVHEGRFAYVKIPLNYYEKFQVTKEDLEGFVEQLRKIHSVRVAMIIKEDVKNNKQIVKISMRSHGDDDVRTILASLGGGGHKNAAGAHVDGTMDAVITKILPLVESMWEKQ